MTIWQKHRKSLPLKQKWWWGYLIALLATLAAYELLAALPDPLPVGLTMLLLMCLIAYLYGALPAFCGSVLSVFLTHRAFSPVVLNRQYGFTGRSILPPEQVFILGVLALIPVFAWIRRAHLRAAQERRLHKSILNNINDAIITTDTLSRIEYLNPAAETLLGVPHGELRGQPFDQTVEIRDAAHAATGFLTEQVRRVGVTVHATTQQLLVRADGTTLPVEASAAPVRDHDGEISGVVITIRDISIRRQIEIQMRERLEVQERLENLSHSVPGALFEFQIVDDAPSILTYGSPQAKVIFGVDAATVADPLGAINAVIHPDDLQRTVDSIKQSVESLSTLYVEHRILHPQRGLRWIALSSGVSLDANGARRIHGLMMDVTDRKQMEERLRASELQLHAALQGGGMGLVRIDLDSGEVQLDVAAQVLWGLTDAAVVTVDQLTAQIDPAHQAEFRADVQALCDGPEQTFQHDYCLRLRGGEERWLLARGCVSRDGVSNAMIKVGVVMDNTQARITQDQLVHSQKMESLGVLASGIAHDFNNLLLAISGNAQLLLEDINHPDALKPSIQEISKAATRASELVRRILSFASAPDLRQLTQSYALRPLLDDIVGMARAVIPATVTLTVDLPQSLPPVSADSDQVHQALINLLTNAADAVRDQHGSITVTADRITIDDAMSHRPAEVSHGPYVRITVTDNGPGISQANLQRIFDPFFTTKAPGRGTGLGLAIVHGIMTAVHGAVVVTSAAGAGARFELYFKENANMLEHSPRSLMSSTTAKSVHILYVDDEEALTFLMKRTLERTGHRVTSCTSPEQALELVTQQGAQFDVVVSDMAMPGMSGLDLAQRIRIVKPTLPFILTSGYLDGDDVARAQALGVRRVILKPNTVDELGQALLEVFQEPEVSSPA